MITDPPPHLQAIRNPYPARLSGPEVESCASSSRAGRRFEQSGCEGCHRLAGEGNAGPGPPLDDIGSRLSERQLVRALVDPRAPMPSFKNLPPAKFKALIEFLSLLRRA